MTIKSKFSLLDFVILLGEVFNFLLCFFSIVIGNFIGQFTKSDDERDEKELDLISPDVVTKYKSAAEFANGIHSLKLLCLYLVHNFYLLISC